MNFLSRTALVVICLLIVFPLAVQAGSVMKVKSVTEAHKMMGREAPRSETVNVYYFDGGNMRGDLGDTLSVLFSSGDEAVKMVRHNPKVWMAMPLKGAVDSLVKEIEQKSGKEAAEQTRQMMETGMRLSAEVTPTDETREINGFKCKKYNVLMSMGMVRNEMEWWVTDEIDINYELLPYASWSQLASFPGFDEAAIEMGKIKGVTVKGVNKTLVMQDTIVSTTELLSVEKMDVPADKFKIPADYTEEKLQMGGAY
jgi:hypothetical protein